MRLSPVLIVLAAFATPVFGQSPDRLEEEVPSLMAEAGIPGLAAVLLKDGEIAQSVAFGVKDVGTGNPVTSATVFEAASLSKPVVAYIAMKLVARDELDLDSPLWDEVGYARLDHDPRARRITARMVLSHTSGLPNWGGTPLELNQDPGASWNYSGEGFVYLATMLERKTGLTLDRLADREVFTPLGMEHSSFVWISDYDQTAATPHDMIGRVGVKNRPEVPNAASSLQTTAEDYARFLLAVMDGAGLPDKLGKEMLTAQAKVSGWGDQRTWEYLSWGLGWGLQRGDRAPAIWHWGDNGDFRCFVIAYPTLGDGLVYFTNSRNGLSIAESIVDLAFKDSQWALKYLDYQKWDQPRRRARIALHRTFFLGDEAEAWELLKRLSGELPANVAENETKRVADFLIQEGKTTLGLSVLTWGAERFSSTSFYRALGDAYTEQGEYSLAASNYEAAIQLDSSLAEDVAPRLEWLREGIEAQDSDFEPEPGELMAYKGSFGVRTIRVRDGRLVYTREGAATETPLEPLAPDLFALKGNTTFRIRFERDDSGMVCRIIGLYADGRTDVSERSES